MLVQLPLDGGDDRRGRIVGGLSTVGYAVEPVYFSPVLVRALQREIKLRDRRNEFQEASIGRNALQQQNDWVRRDRTRWLDASSLAQCRLLEEFESLRLLINRELFLGLFDFESHFAVYDPGAFYKRHLDAFNGDNPRLVSVVVYLNSAWSPADGGCLRIWPERDARRAVLDVVPRAGTLVCFLSERIPHEVLAANRERFSIAGWFRRNTTTSLCLDPPR
ncbi:MAG: 2OG-Fe(II) oxygenase [Alcanivoracaceae bacterium]|nr:2OG-Fe(II) oxygenase [Alcanivoracaceae bacterium]